MALQSRYEATAFYAENVSKIIPTRATLRCAAYTKRYLRRCTYYVQSLCCVTIECSPSRYEIVPKKNKIFILFFVFLKLKSSIHLMVLKQNKKTMESRFKIREEERRDEDRWEGRDLRIQGRVIMAMGYPYVALNSKNPS